MAEGIRPTERITPRESVRIQPVREQPNLPQQRRQSRPRTQPSEETPPDEQPHQLDVEV
ncbi:hypothetical protein HRbin15_01745 [bacterium HR15]|nr:hypothetical protein HRbin15_01745 [bacterium HR15]